MTYGKQILELTNITKSYSGVTVLRNMDFALHEGEVHCIVGENGAGKSTFIKILSGAITPDYGDILLFGQKREYSNPQIPIELGISTIYQDSDLIDTLTVADNIFLGGEVAKGGVVNKKEQEEITQALLDDLRMTIKADTLVEDISPAQKQMLQIAKALQRKARVIIMDEPTASLGEEESGMLLATVKRLAKEGIGIIYISHYLEEVFELADTITVIKDGNVTGCYEASKVTNEEIIAAMVGREASLFFKRERVDIGEEYLKVERISRMPAVHEISFSVRRGEIFGIGGLVGSGRTELMHLLYGVAKKQTGRILIDGKEASIKSPRDAIANGICMLGEDRKGDGMFLQRSIKENICIVRNENKVFLNLKEDKRATEEMVKKLNLKTTGIDQDIERLSGGNQQKSILARWLLSDCNIIIFDEPTKGVDIGAREEIYKLMVQLARQGKAILMVSSDMPEILSMSDRIGILREGELVSIISPENLTEEKLMGMYLGIAQEESQNERQ
ncbi:sugar ABC transporter ATP-binding protein [Christensenella timonensis]|uniref:sugar ABC transporter ATP-binding protein n=1 Tax=Christensenella timonensis TaxID=1816678 RepID=UPI000832AB8C|nr:sugar ABC transporter ATP-binding protein [Christensenella timonensis]